MGHVLGAGMSWARRAERLAPPWIRRGLRRLPVAAPLAALQRTRARWEQEYEAGDWDRLGDLDELGRYSIIAGYVRHLGGAPRILDIGCGNGVMANALRPLQHTYVGCDHALAALKKASGSEGKAAVLLAADAGRLPLASGSFDVVICNEVLNCLPDVATALDEALRVLTPDGRLIVSLFDAFGREQRDCWDQVRKVCHVEDIVAVTHLESRLTWRVGLFRERKRRQGS